MKRNNSMKAAWMPPPPPEPNEKHALPPISRSGTSAKAWSKLKISVTMANHMANRCTETIGERSRETTGERAKEVNLAIAQASPRPQTSASEPPGESSSMQGPTTDEQMTPRSQAYLNARSAVPPSEREPEPKKPQKLDEDHHESNLQDWDETCPPGSRPTDPLIDKIRFRSHKLMTNKKFDMGLSLVILINSILIGVELSFSLEVDRGQRDADSPVMIFLKVMENFCLIVYSLEAALRLFVWRLSCLKSGWTRF